MMKYHLLVIATCAACVLGFAPPSCHPIRRQMHATHLAAEESSGEEKPTIDAQPELTQEEEEKLGNLLANEEWSGLSMELTEVIATAVVEDLKKNSRDFLGKDDYAIGDFSKEIDKRVKDEVAKMREKDDYEVSIFILMYGGRFLCIIMHMHTHSIDFTSDKCCCNFMHMYLSSYYIRPDCVVRGSICCFR